MGPRPIIKGTVPAGFLEGKKWVFVNDNSELTDGDFIHISIIPNNQMGQSGDYYGVYNETDNTISFNDGNPPENIDEIYGENITIEVLKPDIDLKGVLAKLRKRQAGGGINFESLPDEIYNKRRRLSFGTTLSLKSINKMINEVMNC
jgi:hypothetical protein